MASEIKMERERGGTRQGRKAARPQDPLVPPDIGIVFLLRLGPRMSALGTCMAAAAAISSSFIIGMWGLGRKEGRIFSRSMNDGVEAAAAVVKTVSESESHCGWRGSPGSEGMATPWVNICELLFPNTPS